MILLDATVNSKPARVTRTPRMRLSSPTNAHHVARRREPDFGGSALSAHPAFSPLLQQPIAVEGLRPDIAIVGVLPNRHEIYDYTGRLMRALGHPAIVFPPHWLYCGAPAWKESMTNDVKEFAQEVKATSPESNVIIPNCFEPTVIGRQEHRE